MTRDCLAKALYNRMIKQIIEEMNKILSLRENVVQSLHDGFIGIFDSFGFESQKLSCYENMCKNYSAEKIENFYSSNLYRINSIEKEAQKTQWDDSYFVNAPCVNLFEETVSSLLKSIITVKSYELFIINRINLGIVLNHVFSWINEEFQL